MLSVQDLAWVQYSYLKQQLFVLQVIHKASVVFINNRDLRTAKYKHMHLNLTH